MRGQSHPALAATVLFVVSMVGASILAYPTEAQRTTPAAAAPQTLAHARPIAAHVVFTRASVGGRTPLPARNGFHFNSATHSFVSSDGSSVSLQDLLNPVPPPGFDYQFLSVMNQDLTIKALIDPATEWKLALAERLLRDRPSFGGAGFYLLDGGGAYAAPDDSASADSTPAQQPDQSAQQPQIIVVQAAPPSQQAADQPAAEDSEPLPDVGEFTLILQNGTQLQAVAFTRVNDRIVYITADGSRRTFAVTDLNSDATVRVNEERGTPLQLPL
jgi:hypothetical protein